MAHDYVQHGTQAFSLSPSSIIGTAQADLKRRADNVAVAARGRRAETPAAGDAGAGNVGAGDVGAGPDKYRRYAFKAGDVRASTCVADLLRRALRRAEALSRQPDIKHRTRSQALLYGDPEALRGALQMAAAAAEAWQKFKAAGAADCEAR